MQNLYFSSCNQFHSISFANTLDRNMNLGFYFILAIFFLLIFFAVMVAKSATGQEIYSDINTEEWLCPNCGFEVQAGDMCIYCDTPRE